MPNQNPLPSGLPSPGRSISGSFRDYAGANSDRRSKFEARSARRYGDWGILGVPTPVLWFDELYAELEDPFLVPPVIDIWS